jgi:hypothetical protein
MHVRNCLKRPKKTVRFKSKEYTFPYGKWVFVDDIDLFKYLSKFPDVFQVSEFEMNRYDNIKDFIKLEEQNSRVLIKTGDSATKKELDKLPFTKLQAVNKTTGEYIYRITDYLHPDYINLVKAKKKKILH